MWLGAIYWTSNSLGTWPEYLHAGIASQKRGTTANQRAADLRFYTVSETDAGGFFNYERMRIGSRGGLGININSSASNNDPQAYLNVWGGIGIGPGSSSLAISFNDGVNNSIQICSDTYYGGVNNDHSGYLIYSIMPGGWGTGELRFACANNWASYNTMSPALRITQTQGFINGALITTSDARLKTNIKKLEYGLEHIMKLKPVYYTKHVADSIVNGQIRYSQLEGHSWQEPGFIAQEVYKIIPELVSKPKDESKDFWGLDYTHLIPVLTKAIQEQQSEIENLKQRILYLENKLENNNQKNQ